MNIIRMTTLVALTAVAANAAASGAMLLTRRFRIRRPATAKGRLGFAVGRKKGSEI